tara:strand:- start:39 stop:167 length:129 start_codon:yes stop_codon:yes gene_type:complete
VVVQVVQELVQITDKMELLIKAVAVEVVLMVLALMEMQVDQE